ncbi:hypothetical protein [Qipengyuania zhejiangensis]|uniref:hypothetical protein n=1 Tax=Qipengyuania zhejiangensis TaxID=3077782 RepID=UPI002D78DB18|nr:hypothetical protein [Qipengyuania sp. Z2]
MDRLRKAASAAVAAALLAGSFQPAQAASPRKEYWEGQREIARERAELRRDILKSESKEEARQAYKEGMREIRREQREMRREIRQAVHQRYIGRLIAGVILGEIVGVPVMGRPPVRPPRPDLCWFWSNTRRDSGYWYYCTGY